MKRRTALKIVALGALSTELEASSRAGAFAMPTNAAWVPNGYKLQFFTPAENELLDRLSEMIIPSDSHSPGAHAAQVSLFADLMVATSDEATKRLWRDGLRWLRETAAKSSLADALAQAAAHEEEPRTDVERFFRLLKEMTIDGYYTSKIGIDQDLEYIGNTYLASFPGYPPLP